MGKLKKRKQKFFKHIAYHHILIAGILSTLLIFTGGFLSLTMRDFKSPSPIPFSKKSIISTPTANPTPIIQVTTTQTNQKETVYPSSFYLGSATLLYGKNYIIINLIGTGFGSSYNAILFYTKDGKTISTGPTNWRNTFIDTYLPTDLPKNEPIQVAVKRTDNQISNKQTFQISDTPPTQNSAIDCDTPSNVRVRAEGSTAVVSWDAVANVRKYTVLWSTYNSGSGWSYYVYPRSATDYEGFTGTEIRDTNMIGGTDNAYIVRTFCTNGYTSLPSSPVTVHIP